MENMELLLGSKSFFYKEKNKTNEAERKKTARPNADEEMFLLIKSSSSLV